jgi:hypothetical protein
MKALSLGLAAVLLAVALPAQEADAHGRRVSFGIGIGYPAYYRPYYPGYYGGYYGGYYPRSYIGFNVWPRYRTRRARSSENAEIRNETLYVYPAAGQSEQQLADDRYDCHVWAVDATDYDPTLGAGTRSEAQAYGRAFTACMEGRNYVVK